MSQDLNRKTSQPLNFKDQWTNVLKKLNNEYGNEIFNSWIKNIKIQSHEGEVIFFTVPTRFIRDWITSHYLDKIIFFLNTENPDIKRVKINIDNSLSSNTHQIENNLNSTKPYSLNFNNNDEWPLDERFTFEKFIVGPSNELAFASAKRLSLSEKFEFSPYLKQSLELVEDNVNLVFGKEKDKQVGLAGFI